MTPPRERQRAANAGGRQQRANAASPSWRFLPHQHAIKNSLLFSSALTGDSRRKRAWRMKDALRKRRPTMPFELRGGGRWISLLSLLLLCVFAALNPTPNHMLPICICHPSQCLSLIVHVCMLCTNIHVITMYVTVLYAFPALTLSCLPACCLSLISPHAPLKKGLGTAHTEERKYMHCMALPHSMWGSLPSDLA